MGLSQKRLAERERKKAAEAVEASSTRSRQDRDACRRPRRPEGRRGLAMPAYIVTGLGFGDEGKGLVTDYLARQHKASGVVRFNGGAQAAHNVVLPNGLHHTFSQFGSGHFTGYADLPLQAHARQPARALRRVGQALQHYGPSLRASSSSTKTPSSQHPSMSPPTVSASTPVGRISTGPAAWASARPSWPPRTASSSKPGS
jgi:hypothetical protein